MSSYLSQEWRKGSLFDSYLPKKIWGCKSFPRLLHLILTLLFICWALSRETSNTFSSLYCKIKNFLYINSPSKPHIVGYISSICCQSKLNFYFQQVKDLHLFFFCFIQSSIEQSAESSAKDVSLLQVINYSEGCSCCCLCFSIEYLLKESCNGFMIDFLISNSRNYSIQGNRIWWTGTFLFFYPFLFESFGYNSKIANYEPFLY